MYELHSVCIVYIVVVYFAVPLTNVEMMAPSFLEKIFESHIIMAQVFVLSGMTFLHFISMLVIIVGYCSTLCAAYCLQSIIAQRSADGSSFWSILHIE